MYAGDLGGDVGEVIGIALVGIGVLVGKKYGANAEKRFNRILVRVGVASLAAVAIIVLTYLAIT